MNKKDLPLHVLKALEPFVSLHGELFKIIDPENSLMLAVDKDENSKFYYSIDSFEYSNSQYVFTVSYSPYNDHEIKAKAKRIIASALQDHFKDWTNLLQNYNTIKSFYDDPVLKTFEAEFISEYEFLEEDAEVNPFKTTQILQLDFLLETISARLLEMSDDSNIDQIEIINNDISELRNNLATRSKKWVLEQFSKIYGKIAKQGTIFIKEFWSEGKKELIKNLVKGLIDSGNDFLN